MKKVRTKRAKSSMIGIRSDVMSQFEARVSEYAAKKQRMDHELNTDLHLLYEAYGAPAVNGFISHAGLLNGRAKIARAGEAAGAGLSSGGPASTASDKGSRNNGLLINDLRPHVLEAIEKLKTSADFTSVDVSKILREKGLKFEPSYVSYILAHHDQLKVTGKRKIEGQKGQAVRVFAFKK